MKRKKAKNLIKIFFPTGLKYPTFGLEFQVCCIIEPQLKSGEISLTRWCMFREKQSLSDAVIGCSTGMRPKYRIQNTKIHFTQFKMSEN